MTVYEHALLLFFLHSVLLGFMLSLGGRLLEGRMQEE